MHNAAPGIGCLCKRRDSGCHGGTTLAVASQVLLHVIWHSLRGVVRARCRFDYILEHRNDGIIVIFANPSKKVVRQLEEAKLVAHIGDPAVPCSF